MGCKQDDKFLLTHDGSRAVDDALMSVQQLDYITHIKFATMAVFYSKWGSRQLWSLQALQAAVGDTAAGGVLVGGEGGRPVYWDSPQAAQDAVCICAVPP